MFKTASWDADDNEAYRKVFQNPIKGKINNKSNELKIKSSLKSKKGKDIKSLNKNGEKTQSKIKNNQFSNKNGEESPFKVKNNELINKSSKKLSDDKLNINVKESPLNKTKENLKFEKKKRKKNKMKVKDQRIADKISKYEALQEKQAKIEANKSKNSNKSSKKSQLLLKLKEAMQTQANKKQKKPVLSLREKMMVKLKSARFRYLNEQIYTTTSKEAQNIFKTDPDAFQAYHEGYRQQVERWPLNPVDNIIDTVKRMPKSHVIADFGCGDAKLAKYVPQKVHSFDLVAGNKMVTACDMAHVPLQDQSVDVVVFCLSLMGTNLHEYLLEANRVLKVGGLLKMAEVESRFDDVDIFIKGVETFGFKKTWKDLSHNLFYFIDFKKVNAIKNKKKLPALSLQPCLYKKR